MISRWFVIDHKGDKGDPNSDSDGVCGFPVAARQSNEGDPNSDSDGVPGVPVAVRKSSIEKRRLVKK
jgi:hypothetical protein